MQKNQQKISASGIIVLLLVLFSAIALESAFVSDEKWYRVLIFTIPFLLIFFITNRTKKDS